MMKNVHRWHALAAVLAVVLFLSAGCSGKREKEEDDKKGGEDKKGVADAKLDFSLTSKQFAEECDRDKAAAKAKYTGKVIELSGLMTGIGRNIFEDAFLILEGGKKSLFGVHCFMAEDQPWLKATPGQTVKVKGTASDFGPPQLVACVITDVSGPRAPTLTAEELAREYAAGQDATHKKYEEKHLFLSGEIAKVSINKAEVALVTFKTTGQPQVVAKFSPVAKKQTKDLTAGQKIKVLGQYTLRDAPDEVGLSECTLVEGGK